MMWRSVLVAVPLSLVITFTGWVNVRGALTESLIGTVVEDGDTSTMEVLIAVGADAKAKDYSGQTLLMYAAGTGRTSAAKVLIDAGADLNARDMNGRSALMCAATHGHPDIARMLRRAGARE